MSSDHPPTMDPVPPLRWAAAVPGRSPWLHEEVARRMEERLQWIRSAPARWAHWEPLRGGLQHPCRAGAALPAGAVRDRRAPAARRATSRAGACTALVAPGALGGARTQWEPPAPGTVQMVWANMALHMAADPQAVLAQWHQALARTAS
jgi:malonyl-CoA O-methyltransferase